MSKPALRERMTVAEVLRWAEDRRGEGRFELVDGQIVAMAGDRVRHDRSKLRAVNELNRAVRTAGAGPEVFVDGIGVSPECRLVRLPDVVVHGGDIDEDAMLADTPIVLVETVSPSSEGRDISVELREPFSIPSVQHDPTFPRTGPEITA